VVASQSVLQSYSDNVSVVPKSVPVVSIPSPELVSILKRVPSNSKINRSNAASPVKSVSDSSGGSIKVVSKGGKDRKLHKHSDKDAIGPSSANEGVTVETVDKSVKFRLKKSKDKNKTDNSDESDSESGSVTIKRKSKKTHKKWLYPEKYDGTIPLALFLTNVESCAIYNDWTETDKLAHVRLRLSGTAPHVGGNNAVRVPSSNIQ